MVWCSCGPQIDLVRSIGESAALGASGAVMWGASADYEDQVRFGYMRTCSISCIVKTEFKNYKDL